MDQLVYWFVWPPVELWWLTKWFAGWFVFHVPTWTWEFVPFLDHAF